MKTTHALKVFGCCIAILLPSACFGDEQFGSLAKEILDEEKPGALREALIGGNPGKSAELIAAMTEKLPVGTDDEYKAIPWIWRTAILAGKKNDAAELKKLLNVSMPKPNEPLRDWQAVVIGGGVINGLSLSGVWPKERIAEILRGDKELQSRWATLLELSSTMADNEKIKKGTRYDALRIVGMDDWKKRAEQLKKYLAKDTDAELQQGAVSALADIRDKDATASLIAAYKDLAKRNQTFAFDAFLREDVRAAALLDAIEAEKFESTTFSIEQKNRLRALPDEKLRQRAEKLFK